MQFRLCSAGFQMPVPATNRRLVRTDYIQRIMRFALLTSACVLAQWLNTTVMYKKTPGCKCMRNNVFSPMDFFSFTLCLNVAFLLFNRFFFFFFLVYFSIVTASSFHLMKHFLTEFFPQMLNSSQKKLRHRTECHCSHSAHSVDRQMDAILTLLIDFCSSFGI